jgi:hypothetical protein
VNGTVDHMTHQTRCQSKLLTKPFIPFFLKKVLNQSLIAKTIVQLEGRAKFVQLQHRNWYKRSVVCAREEAYSGIDQNMQGSP